MTSESVAPALLELQKLVSGSRVSQDDNSDVPYLTIDGKRQVCAVGDYPGYDLWVPKRKPYMCRALIDDMTCNDFSVNLQQAVAFLDGAPMNFIRNMIKKTSEQKNLKKQFCNINSMLVDVVKTLNATGGVK